MKKKIKRVYPIQLGKVLALMYAPIAVIFMMIMLIFTYKQDHGLRPVYWLIIPPAYVVFLVVCAIIGAAIYNLCAKWVGGIEIDVED